ncbi:MAG: FAD-dependent oxidoreductase [Acidobacteriota bacterium]
MDQAHLIVVGGGVAGAAAALRAAQYHLRCIWVTGTRDTHKRSRAAYVMNIDNMIGVHPGIMRDKVARELSASHPDTARVVEAAHFHISTMDLVANVRARIAAAFADQVAEFAEEATEASRTETGFRVVAGAGRHEAPSLVLATGVMDRQPVVHKKKGDRTLAGIHWLFPYANQESLLYCIRCEGHLTAGQRVAVIGAGAGAAEVALMLRERYGVAVTILTAGADRGGDERRDRLLALSDVGIVHGRLTDVQGAEKGARLHGFTVEDGSDVAVDRAFVVMGLARVYNDLARQLGAALEDAPVPVERRHVIVDASSETSVPDLFAVGDMTRMADRSIMKQVYTAQEFAVRAIDTIDRRRRQAHREALLAGADRRAGS